ncbi:predicted protein [Uncinocarpus reesii 1704]|uniref:BTB domain-containing protein n=1 Tax=Uncinocarpus reesii (strain UAMH 1704) TaxID=336963 RepID=C4JKX1_UNCRE|nr:uncharacterized protein UREG_00204 [Uncinocarpus reesii 1704]EEP75358.1 predicted protein [Uncinocarpus reesii 1704]
MDQSFGELICSNLFTFLIGPQKVAFKVHSDAIAKQSPALSALVHGGMIEAKSRRVEWPDVDEDTFVRFCEFCYSNDYSAPVHERVVVNENRWGPRLRARRNAVDSNSRATRSKETEPEPLSQGLVALFKSCAGWTSLQKAKEISLLLENEYPPPKFYAQCCGQFVPEGGEFVKDFWTLVWGVSAK